MTAFYSNDAQYLVAIGLIEQNSKRFMPIGGKSLKEPISKNNISLDNIETIALELLLRIIDRSAESAIQKVNGDKSILILLIPMQAMQNELPGLKAMWIENGDTRLFLSKLKGICNEIWNLRYVRYEGIQFNSIIHSD